MLPAKAISGAVVGSLRAHASPCGDDAFQGRRGRSGLDRRRARDAARPIRATIRLSLRPRLGLHSRAARERSLRRRARSRADCGELVAGAGRRRRPRRAEPVRHAATAHGGRRGAQSRPRRLRPTCCAGQRMPRSSWASTRTTGRRASVPPTSSCTGCQPPLISATSATSSSIWRSTRRTCPSSGASSIRSTWPARWRTPAGGRRCARRCWPPSVRRRHWCARTRRRERRSRRCFDARPSRAAAARLNCWRSPNVAAQSHEYRGAPVVGLVGSSAGGVEEIRERLIEPLQALGWRVAVRYSDGCDMARRHRRTRQDRGHHGYPVRHPPRLPERGESAPRRRLLRGRAGQRNTVAKLALGIADNQALTQVCEATRWTNRPRRGVSAGKRRPRRSAGLGEPYRRAAASWCPPRVRRRRLAAASAAQRAGSATAVEGDHRRDQRWRARPAPRARIPLQRTRTVCPGPVSLAAVSLWWLRHQVIDRVPKVDTSA